MLCLSVVSVFNNQQSYYVKKLYKNSQVQIYVYLTVCLGASQVAQWQRIFLPMKGIQ